MADLRSLQSQDSLYRLASGDTSPFDSIGQSQDFAQQPEQYAQPSLPQDYNPIMPPMGFGMQPRTFVEPQPQQTKPVDNDMQRMLTNILRAKESSGNYQAVNPKSSASGAYQYTDSTWNGYGGYSKAALAPASVQDAKFAQDISHRLSAYGNDPYKAIVAHYLPAIANRPERWAQPFRVGKRVVKPALSYLRYVVHGTPLEAGLQDYLLHIQNSEIAANESQHADQS